MSIWEFRQRWVNRNLIRFMNAQARAEARGDKFFVCPSCQGVATWERQGDRKRLICWCNDCGMYLRD